jgi:hypothetical protein
MDGDNLRLFMMSLLLRSMEEDGRALLPVLWRLVRGE